MIIEAGHFAFILAFVLAAAQSLVSAGGAWAGLPVLYERTRYLPPIIFSLITLAFAALIFAHASSDFSVLNVYQNSHSDMPLLFKLTGVWGNHEGSMVLFAFVLALFSLLFWKFAGKLPADFCAYVTATQGLLTAAILGFILLTSNPFNRLDPAPLQGEELNPILQDIGLAIHPPLLYVGYIGFSMTFSFAIAALASGRIDKFWARNVRPWILTAWIFLTLGIAMGSYWAYYELGWGGWWFWDPVENASLMPWLSGTALLHSVRVMELRGALKIWSILLAILTFALSLLGTFLVRSGILVSVHSFASDPQRGLYILLMLAFLVGGALMLFALRTRKLRLGSPFAPVSREGALVMNNLFLACACATILIGTLYPLALEALGGPIISVGAPFFNAAVIPLILPLFLIMPIGPMLAYRKADLKQALRRLTPALAVALGMVFGLAALEKSTSILAYFSLVLAVWILAGTLNELIAKSEFRRDGIGHALRRIMKRPAASHGMSLAHLGLAISLLGMSLVGAYEREAIENLKPSNPRDLIGFNLTLEKLAQEKGENFEARQAHIIIRRDGIEIARMVPEKRYYPVRETETSEAAIHSLGFSQLYLSLGQIYEDGSADLRLSYKPSVTLIWLGALVMATGGMFSLAGRRRMAKGQVKGQEKGTAKDEFSQLPPGAATSKPPDAVQETAS